MLKGTYVFKENGLEVGRSENIITTNGKTAILQYLSGSLSEWASQLAVGAMSSTPALTDLALNFEIARSAVTLKSFKVGTPNLLVVKGTLDASVAANIYEVGVFSSNTSNIFGTRDRLIIDDFSILNNWTTASGSYTSVPFNPQNSISPRVGLYSLTLAPNTQIDNTNYYLNLSSYSSLDTLDILVDINSGNSGTLNVLFTDINGNTSNVSYSFDGGLGGYQILSSPLPSNLSSLSAISSISISNSGSTSTINVDAIKIGVFGEIVSSAGIVSRSVLSTPIAKTYGIPLDIEYYLQLT